MLTQVDGRTATVVTAWLAARDESWWAGITSVTIDMSVGYAKAVRQALPDAVLVVDRFHLVKLANEMIDAVRRRITMTRRGAADEPEWVI